MYSSRLARSVCVIAALCISVLRSDMCQAAAQPNIIVLLSDDGGYNEFGFNAAISSPGHTPTPSQAYTPNLDALAAQSVIGRQAYAQPICGESRAALLSGITNNRLGLEENLNNDARQPFGFAAGQADHRL